jgi:uncharacterized repeat protein (TIGR01451 family)
MRAVIVLLFALPLFAQNADLSIRILRAELADGRQVTRVPIGQVVYYIIEYDLQQYEVRPDTILEIDVPGTVTEIFTGGDRLSCTTTAAIRCTFPTSAPPRGGMSVGVRFDTAGVKTAVARLRRQSGTPDPNPADNTSTHTLEALALPALELIPYIFQSRFDPGETTRIAVTVQNLSLFVATNLVLTVTLPAGGKIVSGTPTSYSVGTACKVDGGVLVCTHPSLHLDEYMAVDIVVTAPDRIDGEDFIIRAAVTSADEDVDPSDNDRTKTLELVRQFVVSNVADEGGGSLRQAMHDVNADCLVPKPCAIVFRIPAPVPQQGWFTIQPRTPLPELSGSVKIDGKAQTLATGDTNPDGPEIELDGALVREESGLRLLGDCQKQVRGLTVNGFGIYGIEIRRPLGEVCVAEFHLIEENYLGTDPRGTIAKPNQRGLGLFSSLAATVRNNLISGNLRSGIYADGIVYIDIRNNRIGVTSDGAPLGNGASGVFFNTQGAQMMQSDVRENVIANNAHWAIARTSGGEIAVVQNSIFDNVLQGIDVDLDLRTPNREDDRDQPNHPLLYSATYDPARNATIVRGRLDSDARPYFPTFTIDVYASSRLSVWGMPQAERPVKRQALQSGHEDFEIVVPLDLRGQWITATNTVSHYTGFAKPPVVSGTRTPRTEAFDLPANTSELSDALFVQ